MVQDNNRRMKDSGIPWIGMIPSDWEVEPIGRNIHEVDNPNVGGTETNALQFKAGTIISKSVGDSKYHPTTLEAYNVVDEGVIMLNGLNLSFDLISQRVGLVQEKGVITSAYLAIKPNEQIKSEFLTYLFKAYDARKALHAMGKGLRQTLAWKELKCYSVVYPPFPTQQRIADFLDRKCAEIDELVALQETMIAELKRYKQSLITEAVTKGLDPNVAMKDSGVEWIGKIPEGWKINKGKHILTLLKREVRADDEVVTCFRDGEVVLRKERRQEGFTFSDKEIGYQGINKGDIVIHGMDGFAGAMGVSKSTGKGSPVLIVCVPTHKDHPQYIIYYLRTLAMRNVFLALATGIRERSCDLRWNKISELAFLLPPLSEQRAIADYLDKKCAEIDELIAIKQQKIEALKEYKKSVIFEYVTGKKEVEG